MPKKKRSYKSNSSLKGIEKNTKVMADYAIMEVALFRIGILFTLIFLLIMLFSLLQPSSSNSSNPTPSPSSQITAPSLQTIDPTKDEGFRKMYLEN